jgi:hypothetical protein
VAPSVVDAVVTILPSATIPKTNSNSSIRDTVAELIYRNVTQRTLQAVRAAANRGEPHGDDDAAAAAAIQWWWRRHAAATRKSGSRNHHAAISGCCCLRNQLAASTIKHRTDPAARNVVPNRLRLLRIPLLNNKPAYEMLRIAPFNPSNHLQITLTRKNRFIARRRGSRRPELQPQGTRTMPPRWV